MPPTPVLFSASPTFPTAPWSFWMFIRLAAAPRHSCRRYPGSFRRHQWTVWPHGQYGRKKRNAIQNRQCQDRQRIQTAHAQNQHPAAGDSDRMTEADRAQAMVLAKADRQAVFRGDCAICQSNQARANMASRFTTPSAPSATRPRTRQHGAGFAQPQNTNQCGILADLDSPRQSRLAHARIFHQRWRSALGHANRLARPISGRDNSISTPYK